MAVVGSLLIEMSANVARLQKDMAAARATVNTATAGINSAISTTKNLLGTLGIGLGVGYFVSLTKGAIDAAGRMDDLTQSLGINARELANYQLATALGGTTLEALGRGVKGLATAFSENGDELRAAGITAKDTDGKMRQIADVFASMPDGIEKTTLAVRFFGKSGMDLIPMLNLGSAGLDNAAEKSAKYAAVMAELMPQAAKFGDIMDEISISSKAVGMSVINDALPAMSRIAAAMAQAAHEGGLLRAAWVGLGGIGWEVIFKPLDVILNGVIIDLEEMNVRLMKFLGLADGVAYSEARIARLNKHIVDVTDTPGTTAPPKTFDDAAWLAKYKKMMAALGAGGGAGESAEKERLAMLEKYRQTDAAGWVKYIEAITSEYEDGLRAQAKLDEDFWKGKDRLRDADQAAMLAMYDAQQDAAIEMGAIMSQDITEQSKLWIKSGEDQKKMWAAIESTAHDAFINIYRDGGSVFDRLRDALRNGLLELLYQMTAKKWIVQIEQQVSGWGGGGGGGLGGLLGNIFGGGGGGGGGTAGMAAAAGNDGNMMGALLGSFATGTDYVPKTGPYLLHQGEEVTPAGENRGGDTYYIDARGADGAGVAHLENTIRQLNGSIERRAVAAVADARQRGGAFASAFR